MRSEILTVGVLLAALILIFSRPGPQLWTVAFIVVLVLYGLAFDATYNIPWVELHPHKNREKSRVREVHEMGAGWRHY